MTDQNLPTTTAAASPFPNTITPASNFEVKMMMGPDGFQLQAISAHTIIARSNWDTDLGIAWADLGRKLAPILLRRANSTASPT